MSTVLEPSANRDQPVALTSNSLTGTAANEDSLPKSPSEAAEPTTGWDAYEVWRRLIKDARDRRLGMTL